MPKISVDLKDVPPPWLNKEGWLDNRGYPIIWHDGRWRAKHRVRAEQVLGRVLKRGEEVHHVYGDKRDWKNLVICTGQYHYELHKRCERIWRSWHLPKIRKVA